LIKVKVNLNLNDQAEKSNLEAHYLADARLFRGCSSAGERLLRMQEAEGSNPFTSTFLLLTQQKSVQRALMAGLKNDESESFFEMNPSPYMPKQDT
jgi:hypothetical protein